MTKEFYEVTTRCKNCRSQSNIKLIIPKGEKIQDIECNKCGCKTLVVSEERAKEERTYELIFMDSDTGEILANQTQTVNWGNKSDFDLYVECRNKMQNDLTRSYEMKWIETNIYSTKKEI